MVVRGSVRSQQATAEDRMSRVGYNVVLRRFCLLMRYLEYERASK